MYVKTVALSDDEIKYLRKAFVLRLVFATVFLLPMIAMLGVIFSNLFLSLFSTGFQLSMIIGFIVLLLAFYMLVKVVWPFYVRSYKNTKARNKLVVTAVIKSVSTTLSAKGPRFFVITSYMNIDSWSATVKKMDILFSAMQEGMLIEVHHLENNKKDILLICRPGK